MKGKYVQDYDDGGAYTGPVYRIDMPPRALTAAKVRAFAAALFIVASFIGMGITGNNVTRQLWCGIPYILLIFPAAFAALDTFRLLIRKTDMRRPHYEGSFIRLFPASVCAAILSAAAAAGCAFYNLNRPSGEQGEWLFILFAAVLIAAACVLYRQVSYIKKNIRP